MDALYAPVFCLDNSGSMAGGLNRASVSQLDSLVSEYISDDDRAGLILFSSTVKVRGMLASPGAWATYAD